ncbi:RagB/SusD family nutrient uptake outer membrane protein [Robertkochia solimangrovi]|uniref:RagB/SusD family nutrient uptake outer membrane protein n=1 Tax=Robertkochia solimangrovi TaxID=2213046 RepID=UPI00117D6D00|nr:RagB/SusD family nutrient uptake outer membrane protein [Robertkochia solimangrovi]TRZ43503.1 hypothetical protein DMZ48_08735 [Robertkochia solimangrovi]
MKKYIRHIILLTLTGVLSFSCDNYLDVEPEDKFLETQVFETELGVQNVLNGIYLDMVGNNLYGRQLTMSTLELLGQRFTASSNSHWGYNYVNYSYGEANVEASFDAIWSSAYVTILKVNDLIANMDKYPILTEEKSDIILGEAYAIRAMLHFDLLRIFGPVYSVNPENMAIPYVTVAEAKNAPILPASEVLELVRQDLATSQELLANDYARTHKIYIDEDDESIDFYTSRRHFRMNYFAVKALEARMELYAGNSTAAYTAAMDVINEGGQYFEWTDPADIISAGGNPDRVFSKELLFAPYTTKLYESQMELFGSENKANSILTANPTRLSGVFENNENDYRYNSSWIIPSTGEITSRTFFKYADVTDNRMDFRFMLPLIKKSEMYYIAAETAPETEGLMLLNEVRHNRGLVDLEAGVDILEELSKEYQKEFYGEGQLFFYYKRTNTSRIRNGSSSSSYSYKTMGEDQYVVPLPDSETNFQ